MKATHLQTSTTVWLPLKRPPFRFHVNLPDCRPCSWNPPEPPSSLPTRVQASLWYRHRPQKQAERNPKAEAPTVQLSELIRALTEASFQFLEPSQTPKLVGSIPDNPNSKYREIPGTANPYKFKHTCGKYVVRRPRSHGNLPVQAAVSSSCPGGPEGLGPQLAPLGLRLSDGHRHESHCCSSCAGSDDLGAAAAVFTLRAAVSLIYGLASCGPCIKDPRNLLWS